MDDLDEELLGVTAIKKDNKRKGAHEEGELSGDEEKKKPPKKKAVESKKPLKKRRTEEENIVREIGNSSDEEFYDGFDEELMGDDDDRMRLEALPEIEKEAILSERYDKRKEMKERWQVRRRLKAESKASQPVVESPEPKGGTLRERNARKKQETKSKGKALSELKKKRAKAGYKKSQKDDDEEDYEDGEANSEDEEDEEEDNNYKDDVKAKDPTEHRRSDTIREISPALQSDEDDGPEITLEQMNLIRLPRDVLEKWVQKPFFNDGMPGFFVRIGVGMDPVNHVNVYRVAQIEEVKDGSSTYQLGKVPTNKVLRLVIGEKAKDSRMDPISNHRFSEQEFRRWINEMKAAKLPILRNKGVQEKMDTLTDLKNYKYTQSDITKILEEKKRDGKLPIKIASEKARLAALRDAAKEENPEEYERLCDEIDRLDRISKERYDRGSSRSIAGINQRNKEKNFEQSLKADSNPQDMKDRQMDPFQRRRNYPKIALPSKKTDDAEESLNNKAGPSGVGLGTQLDDTKNPPPVQEHETIDIDIDIKSTNGNNAHVPVSKAASTITPSRSTSAGTKPTLSLTDYMKRQRALME